jgi:hypothetical protein
MTTAAALADLMEQQSRMAYLLELLIARISVLEDRVDRMQAEANSLIGYAARTARLN